MLVQSVQLYFVVTSRSRLSRLRPPAQSKQRHLPPFCVAKSTQLDILKFVFMSVRYLSDLRVKNSSAASCCDSEGAVIFPPLMDITLSKVWEKGGGGGGEVERKW